MALIGIALHEAQFCPQHRNLTGAYLSAMTSLVIWENGSRQPLRGQLASLLAQDQLLHRACVRFAEGHLSL